MYRDPTNDYGRKAAAQMKRALAAGRDLPRGRRTRAPRTGWTNICRAPSSRWKRTGIAAEITLTPGVAVFPQVLCGDGRGWERSFIGRRKRCLRAAGCCRTCVQGGRESLKPQLLSARFPAVEEMRRATGRSGSTKSELPAGVGKKLVFENRHRERFRHTGEQPGVARRGLRIVAQHRNYSQSFYELDFEQGPSGGVKAAGLAGLSLIAWLAVLASKRKA